MERGISIFPISIGNKKISLLKNFLLWLVPSTHFVLRATELNQHRVLQSQGISQVQDLVIGFLEDYIMAPAVINIAAEFVSGD